MKRLYFIRHGLSQMNLDGLVAGTTETPLTDEGRRQAKLAGQAAKGLGIDYIVSSPMSRAHETALIIAREIDYPEDKVHTSSLFIERHFGTGEGKKWSPDLNLDNFSDIEAEDTVLNRAKLALEFLYKIEADTVLVVSHGAFGRALRHVNGILPIDDRTQPIPNAEIVQFI